LAVFLAVRRPAIQLRRMTRRPSRFAVLTAPLARVIRGRADAPPLGRRALLSTGCAVGLCLAGARLDGSLPGWIWLGVPVVAAAGVLVLGWLEPRSWRRRRQQLIMEAPQALELMAACLGAGLPARSACAAVVKCFDGPVADDLGQVLASLQLGVGDAAAWTWPVPWSPAHPWWRACDTMRLRLARLGAAPCRCEPGLSGSAASRQ
jgi:Flp pilus assembly protein TadB